jgi:protein SCO1/2
MRTLVRLFTTIAVLVAAAINPAIAAFDPFAAIGLNITGKTVPITAPFQDDNGKTVRFGDLLHGRPLIVAPVYYKCPNTCGTSLAWLFGNLADIKERSGRDYDVVVFSIDPRERPADAAEARATNKAYSDGVHFLTGSVTSIRLLTEALGFRYQWDDQLQQYAHPVGIAVLTPAGRLDRWLYGFSYRAGELSDALSEANGVSNSLSFGQQILLLCHAYNPVTGKYTGIVWLIFRIGGVLTILGMVFLVVLWRWKTSRRRIAP